MRWNFLRQLWLPVVLLICTFSQITAAQPQLNGLAIHSELNSERFIGALYVEQLTANSADVFNSNNEKRIELRVITKRLSPRRLNKMWIEGMAINNNGNTLSDEAENMVAFTEMVKGSLTTGDSLEFVRLPGVGTQVILNGIEIGRIQSDNFFSLLLSTWIGSVPLSSDFRENLLQAGNTDSAILARYQSLQPAPNRKAEIAAWLNPQPEPKELVAAEPVQTNSTASKPVISAPSLAVAPPKKLDKVASPELHPSSDAKPESKDVSLEKNTPETTKKQVSKTTSTSPKETAPTNNASELAASKTSVEEEDEEDEAQPILTVESLLTQQRYLNELLRHTYKFLSYPDRAIARNQQGSVRLFVRINRKGEVLDIVESELSKHGLLNREALQAVKRAAPYPKLPDSITGDTFSFNLPITFKLPD